MEENKNKKQKIKKQKQNIINALKVRVSMLSVKQLNLEGKKTTTTTTTSKKSHNKD